MGDYNGALTGQQIDAIPTNMGDLASLSTSEKSSLVAAINEVDGHADDALSKVGDLASLNTATKTSLVGAINEVNNNQGGGGSSEVEISDGDSPSVPLLCGQPMILFGAGTPQEAVVPINWKQFDPETEKGYNWNGVPTALGQIYVNTSVTTNSRYIAVRDGNYGLKWIQ